MRRVVVTGIGAITPVGFSAKENWESITSGKSGIRPITLFDASQYTCRIAGEITSYKPEEHFPKSELKKIERFIQFAMLSGKEAIESSGIDLAKTNLEKFGACIGVGMGGLIEIQSTYKDLMEKGPRRISPFFIPMVITNLAAGQLSIKYGLKGPNTCITTACSSSAHAIGESARLIRDDEVDIMLAGGAEAVICELGVGGFCALRALSVRNDDPTKASRPFDSGRDGFVMGEGAAVLVLEELEHAKKRGATILAELVGYGINSDAYHMTQPSPEGEGAQRCMKLAFEDARLSPDSIDYVNAHGTSTPLGDLNEILAARAVFGDHVKKLAISSTKSMTGHLLGASGAVEAMYSVQAIQNQVAPPTINLENSDVGTDINLVPHTAQKKKIDYALSNSFGFGGTNASLIFKRFS